jgi:cytochrome P450
MPSFPPPVVSLLASLWSDRPRFFLRALLAIAALQLYRFFASRRRRQLVSPASAAKLLAIPSLPDTTDDLLHDYLQGLELMCRRASQTGAPVCRVSVADSRAFLVTDDLVAARLLFALHDPPTSLELNAPCVAMLQGARPVFASTGAAWRQDRAHLRLHVEKDADALGLVVQQCLLAMAKPGVWDVHAFAMQVTVQAICCVVGKLQLPQPEIDQVVAALQFFITEAPRRAYSTDAGLREDYMSPSASNVAMSRHAANLLDPLREAACGQSTCAQTLMAACLALPTSICMSLHLLASNAEAQSKVRRGTLAARVACWEAVRLCPPFPILARQVKQDLVVNGEYEIKQAQGDLWFPVWYLGRSTRLWGSDAHEFRPERWLDKKSPLPPGGLLGFGMGQRDCPGRSLALRTMELVIDQLLAQYELRVLSSPAPRPPCAFTGMGVRPFDSNTLKVGLRLHLA